jgi:predicted flap endonuclease-1-like 5' DNA nuclease
MNSNATSGNCQRNCWLAALVVGVLMAWYLMSAGWGFFLTLIIALVIFVAAGRLMTRSFCSDKAAQDSQTASAPAAPPAPAPTPAPAPAPVVEATPEPEPEPAAMPEPEAAPEPEVEPEIAPAPAAQASSDAALLKPSTVLPGQEELASRKGTWRYGGDPTPAPAKPAAETPAAAPVEDGSGQPAGLAQARDGGADNLKLIKGVGPKLERVLNGMGYFHFDQIAGWSDDDIDWVDNNLVGFKGRVSRDGWVDQAKALAAGEETEFAKRAKRDKIYD